MPLLILALLLEFPGLVLAEEPKEAKVLSDYMERRARFELASNCEPDAHDDDRLATGPKTGIA